MTMPTVEEDVRTIKRICKGSEEAEGHALLRYSALRSTPRFKAADSVKRTELVKMVAVSDCRHDQRSTARKHRKEPVKAPLSSLSLEIYNRYLELVNDGMAPADAEKKVADKLCVGLRTVHTSVLAAESRVSKERFERDIKTKATSNTARPALEQLIFGEDIETLKKAVDSLPPLDRQIVELAYFHDMPYDAAALECGLTIDQFKKSLARALELLRQQVTE